MRDYAGGKKSDVIIDFIESKGLTNHFSKPYEQWQSGTAEDQSTL
jgi:hypothetical protein